MQVETEQVELTFTAIAIGLAISLFAFGLAYSVHRRLLPGMQIAFRPGVVIFAAAFLILLVLQPIVRHLVGVGEEDRYDLATNLPRIVWVQGSVCLAALIVVAARWRRKGLAELGFRMEQPFLTLFFGFVSYIAFYPIYVLCCYLNNEISPYEPQQLVNEILENPELLHTMPVVLSACLIIPIEEEILFRGFLLSGLRDVISPVPAVVLSAAFFGCMHETQAIFPVFALGCILGWLRLRTGSIFPSMLVHALHNTLMLAALPFV